jgi:isopenicillin N synthase-like dioxygenase
MTIPSIDVSALFGGPSRSRDAADRAIFQAAIASGFMTIAGLPAEIAPSQPRRKDLLRLFTLPEAEKRTLLRRTFDASRPNLYRGFFPLQAGGNTYKEGIDMGPDVAYPAWRADPADPLTETTPLPGDAALPGWRVVVRAYYIGMERLGATLMRSLARSLKLDETTFDEAFVGGISTLRLIRYPERTEASLAGAKPLDVVVEHKGERRFMVGGAHVDSGFVTLLAQDGVEGLQAKAADGTWIDVPPIEGSMAVNFGGCWSAGPAGASRQRSIACWAKA